MSIWHVIVVLLVVSSLLIGLVIWLVVRSASRRSSIAHLASHPVPSAPIPPPVELRLHELAAFRSKGLITDAEHDQRRAAILASI